jgi:alpha-beta hydrolase superfamily lysophospholipase
MITTVAMSSTIRAASLLLLGLLGLGACSARLPPYGTPDQTLVMHPVADEVFTMADGTQLPARVWLPADGQAPTAVLLALHGFNDSRDQWALPGPVFAAAGIALYAPDQRGFGDTAARATWPGVAALVDDADAMARDLHRRYPATPLYVMGESMGGAVALDLAARPNPPPIAGTIMLSPAVWGRAEQGLVLASALWAANTVIPGYRITAGDVPVRVHASDNRAALIALAKDPLTIRSTQVAVLNGLVTLMDSAQAAAAHVHGRSFIAYGGHDELVPASAMAVAWAHLPPDTRRAVYPNGYHLLMRDLDRQAVIGDVISWIQHPDAALPSGADIAAAAWASRFNPGGGIEF